LENKDCLAHCDSVTSRYCSSSSTSCSKWRLDRWRRWMMYGKTKWWRKPWSKPGGCASVYVICPSVYVICSSVYVICPSVYVICPSVYVSLSLCVHI